MTGLKKYMKSALYHKIIKFFAEHPGSIDTSRGIATWIGESIPRTDKALKELAKAKILISHVNRNTRAYGFTTDKKLLSLISVRLKRQPDMKKRYH